MLESLRNHYESQSSGKSGLHKGLEKSKHSECLKCKGFTPLYRCIAFLNLNPTERMAYARASKICIACLNSKDHAFRQCAYKKECQIDGCKATHNVLLHGHNVSKVHASDEETKDHSNSEGARRAEQHNIHQTSSSVLSKVLPVTIYGENVIKVETFAFLDGGSALTLMNESLFKRLNIKGTPDKLALTWTNDTVRLEPDSKICSVKITGRSQTKLKPMEGVRTVRDMCFDPQNLNVVEMTDRYPYLKGVPVADLENSMPEILIGLKHPRFLAERSIRTGEVHEPVAARTELGWILYGRSIPTVGIHRVPYDSLNPQKHLAIRQKMEDEDLHKMVKYQFSIENFGVVKSEDDVKSADEHQAWKIINSTMRLKQDHYEIGLLWKDEKARLPDNYAMALSRLKSQEKSLKKDPDARQWVNDHVQELIKLGHAREASDEELKKNGREYDIYHHSSSQIPINSRLKEDWYGMQLLRSMVLH